MLKVCRFCDFSLHLTEVKFILISINFIKTLRNLQAFVILLDRIPLFT